MGHGSVLHGDLLSWLPGQGFPIILVTQYRKRRFVPVAQLCEHADQALHPDHTGSLLHVDGLQFFP
jgi:hypothetical protein